MLGFTKQEQGVILFLLATLLVGVSGKVYREVVGGQSAVAIDSTQIEAFVQDEATIVESSEPPPAGSGGAAVSSVSDSALRATEAFCVHLNTATAAQLQTVPNIGPVLAERIVAYRAQTGGFKTIAELISVKGIGKTKYNKIYPYLTLE